MTGCDVTIALIKLEQMTCNLYATVTITRMDKHGPNQTTQNGEAYLRKMFMRIGPRKLVKRWNLM